MARFVGLLLVAPWLAILAWLYWLYARKVDATPQALHRDVVVVVAAFIAAILASTVAWQAAFGHAGAIWKHVVAALGANAGFNLVLGYGLLHHLWRNRRRRTAVVIAAARDRRG